MANTDVDSDAVKSDSTDSGAMSSGAMSSPITGSGGSKFIQVFATVSRGLNSFGSVWIFFLMFLVCGDVLSRLIVDKPIRGVSEIVTFSIVAIVFLQLADTLASGWIRRSRAFVEYLQRNYPFSGFLYQGVFHFIGTVVFTTIAVGTYPKFIQTYTDNDFYGVSGDFESPVWPIKLVVVLGAAMMAMQFLIMAVRDVGSIKEVWRAREARGWVFIVGLAVIIGIFVNYGFSDVTRFQIGVAAVASMFVLIYAGMHIGVALIVLSFLGMWMIKGDSSFALRTVTLSVNSAVESFVFGVVPLFVLMGLLVNKAGFGRDTFNVAQWMLGRVLGGLGVATVAANAVFAAITGVTVASASVFTRIAVPPMIHHGYTPKFAVGVVSGSSVLGNLIPPSLLLIIYGILSETSVGDLFIAGIVPGLLLALSYALAIMLMSKYWPSYVGNPQPLDKNAVDSEGSGLNFIWALKLLIPIALLVFFVLGGIYGGLFTPTEAGAVGAAGALVLALLKRRLTRAELWDVLVETGHITVTVLFLIIAANVFSRMLALSGVPSTMVDVITGLGLGLFGIMIGYLIMVIILGMFLDSISIMLITLPLMLPVVSELGGDLIWFGIVAVISVEIGLLTPPLGLTIFAVSATIGEETISLNDVFAGAFPFVIIMTLVTLLLISVPQLSLLFQ